jgi:hypothetical protein
MTKGCQRVSLAPKRHGDTVIEAWLTGRRRLVARRGDDATTVGSASADASSRLRPPSREGRMRGVTTSLRSTRRGTTRFLPTRKEAWLVTLGQGMTRN